MEVFTRFKQGSRLKIGENLFSKSFSVACYKLTYLHIHISVCLVKGTKLLDLHSACLSVGNDRVLLYLIHMYIQCMYI